MVQGSAMEVSSTNKGKPPTMEQMGKRIQELEERLMRGQAQLTEAELKLQAKVKFKEPEEYRGDRGKLNSFLAQIELHLTNYSANTLTDTGKVMMAASYLRGKAFIWIEPILLDWRENE